MSIVSGLFTDEDFSQATIEKGRNAYFQRKTVRATHRCSFPRNTWDCRLGKNHRRAREGNLSIDHSYYSNSYKYKSKYHDQHFLGVSFDRSIIVRVSIEQNRSINRSRRISSAIHLHVQR